MSSTKIVDSYRGKEVTGTTITSNLSTFYNGICNGTLGDTYTRSNKLLPSGFNTSINKLIDAINTYGCKYTNSLLSTVTQGSTVNSNLMERVQQAYQDKLDNLRCNNGCTGNCFLSCYGKCANENCSFTCGTSCTVNCGSSCEGYCSNGCSGTCASSTCTSNCGSACAGGGCTSCTTGCSSGCTRGCKRTLIGACTCKGGNDGCKGTCKTECDNNCGGSCSDNCSSKCTGNCGSDCTGKCAQSSCTTTCGTSCAGNCGSNCTGSCASSCSSYCETAACKNSCTSGCSNSARIGSINTSSSKNTFTYINNIMLSLGFTSYGSFVPSWDTSKTCYIWSISNKTYPWSASTTKKFIDIYQYCYCEIIGSGINISNALINDSDCITSGTIWNMLKNTRNSIKDDDIFIPNHLELIEAISKSSSLSSYISSVNTWTSSIRISLSESNDQPYFYWGGGGSLDYQGITASLHCVVMRLF